MRFVFGLVAIVLSFVLMFSITPAFAVPVDGEYKDCGRVSFDGIGKCYFGREISQVLGHEGFGWLERSSRANEEKPERAIAALPFSSSDVVADVGAGVGYMSFLIAPKVGKVLAVDVQSEMLEMLEQRRSKNGLTNVETVLGSQTGTNLAAGSIDWAIMVDAYHEFEYPKEMMRSIFDALKPGGKAVLFEYKGENPLVAIKPHHKMTQTQARTEVESIGFKFVENKRVLPQQHVLVFQKP